MVSEWQFEVPTAGSKHLPPDGRYMEALSSQGYGFEVAIADLVDNSIDAGAGNVVVHFLRDGDQLVSLVVVDDGKGMDENELDVAMTVGGRRGYDKKSLGMFGTGLKSASLSHANSVTVVSRTKRTRPAGRRWLMERAKHGFECDIIDPNYAQDFVDFYQGRPIAFQGTIVRWDDVKDFPNGGAGGQTDRYLQRTVNKLGLHLGLHLHRFLARDDFHITISVQDVRTGVEYANYGVESLDPFAYPVSGNSAYPSTFTAEIPALGQVHLDAHVWPPRSSLDEYKAFGAVVERSGFYFYRNDRLVQAGGWNNFRQPEQHLALARVAVDLPDDPEAKIFRLTVKKDGVQVSPEFVGSLEGAENEHGRTFAQYVVEAEHVYREARRHVGVARKAAVPPGRGIDPQVRQVIEEELPVLVHEEPLQFRWQKLANDKFFEIDQDGHVLLLNQHYRAALLGGRDGSLNDAPMVKSLIFLLMQDAFQRERMGSRLKDNIELWQSVLVAAARAELDRVAD
ncbi:Histidine kinase-, DNA gyrase B-, and HSP90-like ATPase [Streptomyces sp. yr375]|uniref:ATP-binding protein n=1 Tax=Streptomyces sp. yr375 TaxID=1761906 RepID=UPI0008C9A333|nr:ATP-binding protein [Streptomyces sp. yr375]SEQ31970.1 Histidine kinase-, DNA gyrase B-, and HSP90-like ATPase [Streptomyces sp. yr375]